MKFVDLFLIFEMLHSIHMDSVLFPYFISFLQVRFVYGPIFGYLLVVVALLV